MLMKKRNSRLLRIYPEPSNELVRKHIINIRSFNSYYLVKRGFIDLIFWMKNLKLLEVE